MSAERSRRIAVIGGGVSGLTAAREAALIGGSGTEVSLLEAADRLGGRIRRETLAGVPIDIGAEAFATRGGGVAELLAELGIEAEIVPPAKLGSWVIAGARAVRLPAAGTAGIPAEPLSRESRRALGLPGSVRAAAERLLPRRVGARSESLAELVRVRLGRRVLERLVGPVVLGVHSTDPSRLTLSSIPGLAQAYARRGSLVVAARELRDGASAAGGAVAGLRDGMTTLTDALAAELGRLGVKARTGVAVERIERRAGAWALLDAEGRELDRAEGVVLAVPEEAARTVLGAPAAEEASSRVEVVALALEEPLLDSAPRGTGALVAGTGDGVRRGIAAKALTHVTAKWPERARRAGSGLHLLRVSYGRAGSPPETAGLGDAAVQRIALNDASRILGVELRAESLRGMVRREWRTNAPPGARGREGSVDPPLAAPPGTVLIGDWVSGTGLASVIPAARAAARQLLHAPNDEGTSRT
ncbi:protoporphyrinogen oxidase [Leucobacter sp. CSA1]|uniref:Coproporphyrinogen III oxidase n=1 Tax=Leucobacter chromiisoli TaxID=2796471 RepID=A0A934Q6Y4_9MICO|nr:protoporphyrinogen oxidase [Leucobacter chromiisoli]MBK0417819.1 protoporphyrinogen oxidase [Leucobacter chromiisoli]